MSDFCLADDKAGKNVTELVIQAYLETRFSHDELFHVKQETTAWLHCMCACSEVNV